MSKTVKVMPPMKLSGLEPFNVTADVRFVNIGERTNVTGSKAFARMILNNQFDEALVVARQQVENGAQVIDINMDEAMLDSEAAMTRFLNGRRAAAEWYSAMTPERILTMALSGKT